MRSINQISILVLVLLLVWAPNSLRAQSVSASSSSGPSTESPELNTFGVQLLRNFKATFTSKQNLLPVVAGGGATAISSIWDQDPSDYFAEQNRASAVGEVGRWLGSPFVIGGFAGGTLLIGYKSDNHKLRRVGYDLSQAFILSQTFTMTLKYTVRRERPSGENVYSFPSGHSSASFATAAVIAHHYPKAAIPAFGVAGFVAFSRLVKGKHWLSDTVAGATLGIIVGMTVVREDIKIYDGRISLIPYVPPDGGVGVYASIER